MNYIVSERVRFWSFWLSLFGSVLAIIWISYNLLKEYKKKRKAKALGLGLDKAMKQLV